MNAAKRGELDTLRGVSANIMTGQEGYFGTSAFNVLLDLQMTMELNKPNPPKTFRIASEIDMDMHMDVDDSHSVESEDSESDQLDDDDLDDDQADNPFGEFDGEDEEDLI